MCCFADGWVPPVSDTCILSTWTVSWMGGPSLPQFPSMLCMSWAHVLGTRVDFFFHARSMRTAEAVHTIRIQTPLCGVVSPPTGASPPTGSRPSLPAAHHVDPLPYYVWKSCRRVDQAGRAPDVEKTLVPVFLEHGWQLRLHQRCFGCVNGMEKKSHLPGNMGSLTAQVQSRASLNPISRPLCSCNSSGSVDLSY